MSHNEGIAMNEWQSTDFDFGDSAANVLPC